MPLHGKTPSSRTSRLKFYLISDPGVGKTTAAINMPRPYVIDLDGGTDHYSDTIERVGGVVFDRIEYSVNGKTHTRVPNPEEVMDEIKMLMTEDHDFLTLVIDPYTALFEETLQNAEDRIGAAHGRHYGEAYKYEKRFINLIKNLDMNVVFTAHMKERKVKDKNGEAVTDGYTFDGGKYLDRLFDLGFELKRDASGKRWARVAKTRMPEMFRDQEVFEWDFSVLEQRYGKDRLWRHVIVKEIPDSLKGINDYQVEIKNAKAKLANLVVSNKEAMPLILSEEKKTYIETLLQMEATSEPQVKKLVKDIDTAILKITELIASQTIEEKEDHGA